MSASVLTFEPPTAKALRLEKENVRLQLIMSQAYEAIRDGRKGDALKLLAPKSITPPIAARGDQA